jgi:hypothetical protein
MSERRGEETECGIAEDIPLEHGHCIPHTPLLYHMNFNYLVLYNFCAVGVTMKRHAMPAQLSQS